MKYLYLAHKQGEHTPSDRFVPVDQQLRVIRDGTQAFLTLGNERLLRLSEHNAEHLLPFLADSFGRSDIVCIYEIMEED